MFSLQEGDHHKDDLTGSESDDIDFSKEIHPIGYYINDREKMIEQMFSIIKGEKLKKMLPPILKKSSLEEIKADCLVHLLGMSKKRIFAILEGRDLNSSSDSETDSCESSNSSADQHITSSTQIKSDIEEVDDTLDISVSKIDVDSLIQDKRSKIESPKKRKEKLSKQIKTERPPTLIEISDDDIPLKKKKKEDKKMKKKSKHKHKSKEKPKKIISISNSEGSDQNEDDDQSTSNPKKGKSLLEILELEMRARAIRALLEKSPNTLEPVPVSVLNIKSEVEGSKSNEEIDLKVEDNVDDSVEVVEIINENENDDAIIILDDTEETLEIETEKADEIKNKDEIICIEKEEVDKNKDENEVTWPQRWAESKGVKDVIQNSKICANIRKRMRFARMLKQKQQEENHSKKDVIADEMSKVEEGSVDQLELIKSLEVAKKANKVLDQLMDNDENATNSNEKVTDKISNPSNSDENVTG